MTVSKMPLSRPESIRCPDASTTSEATGRLSHAVVAHHEQRHVVSRHLSGAERTHVGEQPLEKLLGRLRADRAVLLNRGEQAIVHVLVAGGIDGFCDTVAERDDEVARLELEALFFKRRLLEETEHHAAGF